MPEIRQEDPMPTSEPAGTRMSRLKKALPSCGYAIAAAVALVWWLDGWFLSLASILLGLAWPTSPPSAASGAP